MTAIGKLMAFLLLTIGIALMTWAVGAYVQRPTWFEPAPEGGVDKGNYPVTFAQLKTEIDALNRSGAVASDAWGANLKDLETREAFRAARLKAYTERREWARNGNPKDLAVPGDADSGKAFYEPVIDPNLKLHDLALDATGKPKGAAVLGGDNLPLRGTQKLSKSVKADTERMVELTKEIADQRRLFDETSAKVVAEEKRLIAMNVIRDSVQGELFYLSTFEVNVYETRETVLRREKQLRARLKGLGVFDP